MKHRAFVFRIIPAVLMGLGIICSALRVEAGEIAASDPRAGFAAAQVVKQNAADPGQQRLASLLEQGADAYERAAFGIAVDWYNNARALAPDNEAIKQLLQLSIEKQQAQRAARANLPAAAADQQTLYKAVYDQAQAQMTAGEYDQAIETLTGLWIVAGKYESTVDLIGKAKAELAPKSEVVTEAAIPVPAPAEEVVIEPMAVPSEAPQVEPMVKPVSKAIKAEVDGLVVRAQMELQAGRTESARSLYNKAAELDPANNTVKWNLSQLPEAVAAPEAEVAQSAPVTAPAMNEAPPVRETVEAMVAEVQAEAAPAIESAAVSLETETVALAEATEAVTSRLRQTEIDRKVEELLAQGKAEFKNNNLEVSADSYRQAIELDPTNKEASKNLVRVEQALSEHQAQLLEETIAAAVGQAETFVASNNLDQAKASYMEAIQLDPTNKKAAKGLAKVEELMASSNVEMAATSVVENIQAIDAGSEPITDVEVNRSFEIAAASPTAAPAPIVAAAAEPVAGAVAAAPMDAAAKREQLDRLYRDAMVKYREGNIEEARNIWNAMLAIEPGDKRATTYLAETQAEFDRYNADAAERAASAERQKKAEALLSAPITISTERPTPLSEFMRIISYSTPEDVQYYIADGAEADVFVNFVDKPLRDVLDTVLVPRGLVWEMDDKNVITVKPDLLPRTYNLTVDQMSKVRSLLDKGDLQRVIWGQPEPPAKGVEITVDERQRVLLVVGSKLHIAKIDEFMKTIQAGLAVDLETQIYKIRPEDGAKIKALINALIAEDKSTPFGQERKIFIDGADLIIRDTPENIAKIEELLLDEKFIQDLRNETLDIANFSLVPRDVENQNPEQMQVFTNRIVEAIETFLYADIGKRAAQAAGRRLWFDPYTLQLTVVDYPTNLGKVGNYIDSLPEIRHNKLQKVIFLEHAVAEVLAADLIEVLGLSGIGGGSGGGGGEETIKKLRRGDEITFRDLRVRLIRVEDGDPNDRNDDECELALNTGTQTSNVTLRELDTIYFEDYEITAEDVQPSGSSSDANSTNRGEGSARIRIRFVEPIDANAAAAQAAVAAAPAEEESLSINPFGPLNALIIRYDNPQDLIAVEDLITQLDKPTKQVEVETKFVQVNETRAREFSADFDLAGLSRARDIDQVFDGNWALNSRFAQVRDELRDTLEPAIEGPFTHGNFLRDTTVLDLVLGGSSLPSLNFTLRLLEAEGVINITNGPKVMMLDAVTGEFRIEKTPPYTSRSSQGGGNQGNQGGTQNPFGSQGGGGGSGGGQNGSLREEDGSNFGAITATILEVTPEITSEKTIIFTIVAELLDFDNWVGVPTTLATAGTANQAEGVGTLPSHIDPNPGNSLIDTGTGIPFAQWVLNQNQLFRTRKLIDTTARTHDGGTIVLGGWTGERAQDFTSGVPVLRNMPYFGKFFFSRNQRTLDRVTLLIFLHANLVD